MAAGERVPLGSWDLDAPTRVLDFSRADYRAIVERILVEHAIELVHVRHLFKHTFDVPVLAARLGIPVVFSFHDFYFACPTVHLLDNEDRYCAGRCTPGDGDCHVPPAGLDGLPHLKHAFVHQWREEVSAMLAGVDAFVTTSEHVRAVHRDVLPAIGERPFEVIPHGRTLVQHHGLATAPPAGAPLRILVLANVERHKGPEYLREIKRHAGDRIELHFLGDVPERYADLGVLHGRYRPEELAERVSAIAPAVIGLFSIVAETFSHALTEAWALGIPVVVTDLGAFGERLRAHQGGWLIPPDDAAEAARRILAIAGDPTEYRVQTWRADLRGVATAEEMADGYLALYDETIDRRRCLVAPAGGRSPARLSRGTLRLTAIVPGTGGLYPGSTYVRVVQPLRHPQATRRITTRIRYASDGSIPADAEAVLVQRTALPPDRMLEFLDDIDARRLPLILDLDDHLLLKQLDDEQYGAHHTPIRALLESAALVTVSTPALAEAIAPLARHVRSCRNAIDEGLFLSGLHRAAVPRTAADGRGTAAARLFRLDHPRRRSRAAAPGDGRAADARAGPLRAGGRRRPGARPRRCRAVVSPRRDPARPQALSALRRVAARAAPALAHRPRAAARHGVQPLQERPEVAGVHGARAAGGGVRRRRVRDRAGRRHRPPRGRRSGGLGGCDRRARRAGGGLRVRARRLRRTEQHPTAAGTSQRVDALLEFRSWKS